MSKQNNKLERRFKEKVKQTRRIKIYRRNGDDLPDGFKHRLKTMSTPCSCTLCSPKKWQANGEKKKLYKELQFQINS